MEKFDVPVVLFTFKRTDKTLEVLERIAQIKPSKLYILSDQGRNDEEISIVENLRRKIEERVDWDCELIKMYASKNIGVYHNIGEGAKKVLETEKWAIFLEDDNLPEITFFSFCKEMLEMYKNDTRILWVCGTNYLHKYSPEDGSSYMFTKHMLPCGWASWSDKFNKFYDGSLDFWQDEKVRERVKKENYYKLLKKQDIGNWDRELRRIKKGLNPDSWDYQMAFTIRSNGFYGIVPKYNQIMNIGADMDSTHGGISTDMTMTKRFCGIQTEKLEFPLTHPKIVLTDIKFESLIAKIITLPFGQRLKISTSIILKKILRIDPDGSVTGTLLKKTNKK